MVDEIDKTLPRLPEEDVAFDMDEVVEEEIVDEDDDDSSDIEDDEKILNGSRKGNRDRTGVTVE